MAPQSTQSSPTPHCWVCDEPIVLGERREATRHGPKHWACGSIERPNTFLGQLEPTDFFEISFSDGEYWHYASVEGHAICGREYVVRAILRDEFFGVGEAPPSPLEYSDQFDVVVEPRGNSFSEPTAFEVEPEWGRMDKTSEEFGFETHYLGEVSIRPTDLSVARDDWEQWNGRGIDPKTLFVEYWEKEKSTRDLAEELDVSDWTIRNWMDEADIPRRPPDGEDTVA